MPEVRKLRNEGALYEVKAASPHVAIGRMSLSDGSVHEVVSVSREFLASVLRDAIAWCRETEGPAGNVDDYEAGLAVISPGVTSPPRM